MSFPTECETARLVIRPFEYDDEKKFRKDTIEDLAKDVVRIMTEEVAASLPPPWQGSYTVERAREWLNELRDEEGLILLLVADKKSREMIGFVLLFAEGDAASATSKTSTYTVRIGYMLGKESWGKGYATEIVSSIVTWAKATPTVTRLVGGVARGNIASQKVLEKNGFVQQASDQTNEESEELLFVLDATT